MRWVWTWGGVFFGWIDDDALYTHEGRHVGYLEYGDRDVLVFAVSDGRYLGDVKDDQLLITKYSRLDRYRLPRRQRKTVQPRYRPDRRGRRLPWGFGDFPNPAEL